MTSAIPGKRNRPAVIQLQLFVLPTAVLSSIFAMLAQHEHLQLLLVSHMCRVVTLLPTSLPASWVQRLSTNADVLAFCRCLRRPMQLRILRQLSQPSDEQLLNAIVQQGQLKAVDLSLCSGGGLAAAASPLSPRLQMLLEKLENLSLTTALRIRSSNLPFAAICSLPRVAALVHLDIVECDRQPTAQLIAAIGTLQQLVQVRIVTQLSVANVLQLESSLPLLSELTCKSIALSDPAAPLPDTPDHGRPHPFVALVVEAGGFPAIMLERLWQVGVRLQQLSVDLTHGGDPGVLLPAMAAIGYTSSLTALHLTYVLLSTCSLAKLLPQDGLPQLRNLKLHHIQTSGSQSSFAVLQLDRAPHLQQLSISGPGAVCYQLMSRPDQIKHLQLRYNDTNKTPITVASDALPLQGFIIYTISTSATAGIRSHLM